MTKSASIASTCECRVRVSSGRPFDLVARPGHCGATWPRRVLHWGSAVQVLDFTKRDDTAAYTGCEVGVTGTVARSKSPATLILAAHQLASLSGRR